MTGSGLKFKPSNWQVVGCSYQYNSGVDWKGYGNAWPVRKPFEELSGQTISWVPNPVRYILMYEPPARPNGANYYHWHYARGRSDVTAADLASDGQPYLSPILFIDGHAAKHDFAKSLKTEPQYPLEPAADWIWYKEVASKD